MSAAATTAQLPPLVRGDVRDTEALGRIGKAPEVGSHLAGLIQVGESVREPECYHSVNTAGAATLVTAALEAGVEAVMQASNAAVRSLRASADPQVAGPLASEAIAAIREQLGPGSTPQQQAGALMGAGNAGAVELYDAVEPLLRDPTEGVRELAVRALRLMPAEKALPTLTAQLGAESSDLVRVAILQALISQSELADGRLPAETVQAVLASLAGRQSSGVRMPLLRLLGDAAVTCPPSSVQA